MGLREYHRKRDFEKTPEPRGREGKSTARHSYVIQKHAASRLHYDFRLEMDGVLRSWAVPKGPSLDPAEKRLAVHVEDHPLDYGGFEGTIPKGQYGGGAVVVWDRGRWSPEGDALDGYRKGKLSFELEGEKLHGGWSLVRMAGPGNEDGADNWLLMKRKDGDARSGKRGEITVERPESVLSGRTVEDVGRAQGGRVWQSRQRDDGDGGDARSVRARIRALGSKGAAAAPAKQRVARDAARAPARKLPAGARRAPLPKRFAVELATLVTDVPAGDEWIHEIKFDGYRALAFVEEGSVRMVSRNGKDWTRAFASVAKAVARLPVASAILDGEVVVHEREGVTSFQALQEALGSGRDADLYYYLFDVPYLDGCDLAAVPLLERKELLRALVEPTGDPIRHAGHVRGSGATFLGEACRRALEGIVSKRADSPYRAGRGRDWLKVRCQRSQEFVIGGYTEPSGSRHGLGALLLGTNDPERGLVYAGKVGTGFTDAALADLARRLVPLETKKAPFVEPPRGAEARGVHWVEPKLVAEVEFTEWTRDGRIRHPSWEGLREDKSAAEVVRESAQPTGEVVTDTSEDAVTPETPPAPRSRRASARARKPAAPSGRSRASHGVAEVAGVRITHPDRVVYRDQGLTKLDLARHYELVAERMLPHVSGRPLSLVRCPDGADGECFYQKHVSHGLDESVRRAAIKEAKATREYLHVDDVRGLVALVQVGVLEIHGWGSRVKTLEKPDLLVFDLDPDAEVSWDAVIEGAHHVRERLEELGLRAFVKTTGGKGLHVCVPVAPRVPWDDVKPFTKALVESIAKQHAGRYVTTMSKERRRGKIFLDYLRNGRGATAVMPYSTRARPGAPVATPIRWDELSEKLRPNQFTVANLPRRLAALKRDPWVEFFDARQSITAAMRRAVGAR